MTSAPLDEYRAVEDGLDPLTPSFTVLEGVTVLDLGTLGGYYSRAVAVSEAGIVVGSSAVSTAAGAPVHAFQWTETDGMEDLGTLGGTLSDARAINSDGSIVGYSYTATGSTRAFLWTRSGMRDLGTLGGRSFAFDINDQGTVVGSYEGPSGSPRAFVWTDGEGMSDLGTLGGAFSRALGVNDAGAVVGETVDGAGQGRPFLWTKAEGMRDIGSLGGTYGWAAAINESGTVVGMSGNAANQARAFLWTREGGIFDLGTLGGDFSVASGINDDGVAVGVSRNASGEARGFVWSEVTGMEDLGPAWSIGRISNAGEVAGSVMQQYGSHAALWRVPLEPPNQPPVVTIGAPYSGAEGSAVTFAWSASDADGDPLAYEWLFGDGTSGSGTSLPQSHVYTDNGTYTISLTVSDGKGGSDTKSTTAVITNVAPAVSAGLDASISSGEVFSLTSTFLDPSVDDTPWSYTIDWGDGTQTTASTSDRSALITGTHRYVKAGNHTVTVTVTDDDGDTGEDGLALTVNRLAVDIDIKPGGEPNSIRLNAQGEGMIAVGILSTADFDASQVVAATATLGDEAGTDTPVAKRRNGTLFASTEDVNRDGRADLVLHFSRSDLIDNGDLTANTTALTLSADLMDGRQVRGDDSVRLTP